MKPSLLLLFLCSCAQPKEIEAPSPSASLVPVSAPASILTSPREIPPWSWESPSPQGNPIVDLWGDRAGLVLGVGSKGAVIRSADAQTFAPIYLDTLKDLRSVSGNATYQFIAGDEGLWRSSDRGASWRKLSLTQKLFSVKALSSGLVFALGEENQLLLSSNNGDTWKTIDIAEDKAKQLTTLWASEGGVVIASQPNDSVYQAESHAQPFSASLRPMKGKHIWRSADFGQTWSSISFTAYKEHPTTFWQSPSGKLLGVGDSYIGISSVQICGTCTDSYSSSYSIFSSDDHGESWKRSGGKDEAGMGSPRLPWFQPTLLTGSAHELWMTLQGKLFTSLNDGETWTQVKAPEYQPSFAQLSALWVEDKKVILAASQQLLRYHDKQWTELTSSAIGAVSPLAAVKLNDGSILAVGYGIARRDTSGAWKEILPKMALQSIAAYQKTVWVAGGGGLLMRSTDNGETFQKMSPLKAGTIHAIEGEWYLTGEQGTIARYLEASESWELLDKSTSKHFTRKLVKLSDGALLVSGESAGAEVWKSWLKISHDNGATWKTVEPTPKNFQPKTLLLQQDGTLWLGGKEGLLYQSNKLGGSWREVSLPANGSIVSLQETSDGRLWAFVQRQWVWSLSGPSTIDDGWRPEWGFQLVFSSADQGKSWKQESLPIQPAFLQEIAGGILWFYGNQIIRQTHDAQE